MIARQTYKISTQGTLDSSKKKKNDSSETINHDLSPNITRADLIKKKKSLGHK